MNENAKNEHENTAGLRNPSAEDRFHSVQIGGQEWMAGNLDVGTFLNGDSINLVQEGREWEHCARNAIPAMCRYTGHEDDGGTDFGALYNWYALIDPRGLAPRSWRLPSDDDWQQLIASSGGAEYCGTALKMEGNDLWMSPSARSSNASGFSALPAGMRDMYGIDAHRNTYAYFWSATMASQYSAWIYMLGYFDIAIHRLGGAIGSGFSVRCVR
ncbi:MAG: hypothetical protein A3K90_05655 [Pelodictyon luteolum]|uniref:Fibrobacter succinogenes major paralogous domain-containing protein n=1 Tax=Pelodictyon luteolum TaxID=1100 RepID=A0A165MHT5_PELLU|nr:fibrobacter succinogenes major paralogous domain-containing protein [Pelodictyon luteolum]KZK75261.1 MAG: hypothetical protein A3K90_05655 [Pelodictyon luteolum]